MAAKRFVLFDLGGVLLTPGLQDAFRTLEETHRLPGGFLVKVFVKSGSDGSFARAERGQIPFSQFVTDMNQECRAFAEDSGVTLPETFSLEQAIHGQIETGRVNKPFLKAATALRNNGFKTCVLTNNWVDDGPLRHHTAEIFSLLGRHFDLVIESCRVGMRKPEPRIYEYALKMLRADPAETIFLDDIGANLKPARDMGISTVLVRDTEKALKELQELSGVKLLDDDVLPPVADPDTVSHGYVTVKENKLDPWRAHGAAHRALASAAGRLTYVTAAVYTECTDPIWRDVTAEHAAILQPAGFPLRLLAARSSCHCIYFPLWL